MEYLLFLVGFILLIVSGDILIQGGVSLAKHFKISAMVIGVTIISLGTSLPELFVSASAALNGESEIAIGNVIGSNIANIALVLALTAIILPIPLQSNLWKFEGLILIFASILFYFFLMDDLIVFWEGFILTSLLLSTIFLIFRKSSHAQKIDIEEVKDNKPKFNKFVSFILIIVSCIGLKFGANWLVDSAVIIAEKFNVSKTIISVTLIAFGTSVPELATSIIAAVKKEMDISIGNIIGSNIFNIFGVIGVTSIIKEIQITDIAIVNFNLYIMLAIAFTLFLFLLPIFKNKIARWQGFFLVFVYGFYIFQLVQMQLR